MEYFSIEDFYEKFCTNQYNFKDRIGVLIQNSRFSREIDKKKDKVLHEMLTSIKRCQGHIETILQEIKEIENMEKPTGKLVLAISDLEEELAYDYLLYGIIVGVEKMLIKKGIDRQERRFQEKKWNELSKHVKHILNLKFR